MHDRRSTLGSIGHFALGAGLAVGGGFAAYRYGTRGLIGMGLRNMAKKAGTVTAMAEGATSSMRVAQAVTSIRAARQGQGWFSALSRGRSPLSFTPARGVRNLSMLSSPRSNFGIGRSRFLNPNGGRLNTMPLGRMITLQNHARLRF